MAGNLGSGRYKIISRTERFPPIGIDNSGPAFPYVRVNEPSQQWAFVKDEDDTYTLSIDGNPFTTVIDNKVAVSNQDLVVWRLFSGISQGTYTIVLADDPDRGWTVSNTGEVEIKPITQSAENQSFMFERTE